MGSEFGARASPFDRDIELRTLWPSLAALVLVGVVLRLAVLGGYEPLAVPDTGTYLSTARELFTGDFENSQGRRTPGYPLLIALAGEIPKRVVLVQMLIGLGTSIVLFFLGWEMTRRVVAALIAGLSYHLNLQQLFLEGALLTEPVTTFWVALTMLALIGTLRSLGRDKPAPILAILTGLFGAAAIMVRPQFLFLVLLLPVLVLYALRLHRSRLRTWAVALLVTLPMVLAILGWAKVVQLKTGYFTMSTQSGFGLVNHSVEFIELAPESYATVRDILLRHRAERIAAAGHPGNTIWYAWPEIRQATRWSLAEASRQMQQMSMQMFAEHPLLYAESVAHAWLQFWTVPIIWEPERMSPSWLAPPLQAIWWAEHKFLRLCNLLFVSLVVAVVVSRRARLALRWDPGATAICSVILASSVLQAMADRGAGSRYAMTVQALIVLMLIVWAVRLRMRSAPSSSSNALPETA